LLSAIGEQLAEQTQRFVQRCRDKHPSILTGHIVYLK
jgi:hypothetical protein